MENGVRLPLGFVARIRDRRKTYLIRKDGKWLIRERRIAP